MIIDLILDRKESDALRAQGYTHIRDGITGKIIPLEYNPRKFYFNALQYGDIGDDITRAMDYGTESDVKNALCEYVMLNEYNPDLCEYIRAVNWID